MNRQVEIKCEQIARMIVAGLKATRIAEQMNLSYSGLQRILACPKYRLIETRVRTGVVGKMDVVLDRRAQLQQEVEDAVPEACKVLLEHVTKKRDLRAALELLDRDPQRTLTKSSRTEPQREAPGVGLPQSVIDKAINDARRTNDVMFAVPLPQAAKA